MKKEFSAGVLVFYKEENNSEPLYLILNYPKGYWDFPKGKLELDETDLQAAKRELKEETDLVVDFIDGFEKTIYYNFKTFGDKLVDKKVTYFLGQSQTKKVILSHEHIGYKWLNYKEVYEFLSYKNAKDLIKAAHDFLIKNTLS